MWNLYVFLRMDNDRSLLLKAVKIANDGIGKGGGPFGAVVVKDGKIISEAYNSVTLNNDPTAHAEILAIREASSVLKSYDLKDCTIYSSCEPCPMCLGAIYWAGIKKVVYSSDRNDAARAGFSDSIIYKEIILDPEEREIDFLRIEEEEGENVFKKWNDTKNKIPY